MSYFSDLLTAYSKRIGINSPQIASYCDLDRVTVYRFMKGKNLPKDRETIQKMAEILQLTEDERNLLCEAYDYAQTGPHIYWERKYIKSFLSSFTGTRLSVPFIQYNSENLGNPDNDTLLISRKDHTLMWIQNELLESCEEEQYAAELVMRPGIDPVMDLLLSIGRKKKALNVKHLIPLTTSFLTDSGQSSTSREKSFSEEDPSVFDILSARLGSPRQELKFPGENTEKDMILSPESYFPKGNLKWNFELLQNFFKIVSLCSEGFDYEPVYFYSRQTDTGVFPVYSNLLITKKSAILFTDDLNESILFRNQNHVDAFHKKYAQIAERKPPLSYIFHDIESFMDNMTNVILKRNRNKDETEYFYASQPCIIPLLTKELIGKHLRTEIFPQIKENRNNALKNIYNYIGAIQARYQDSDNNQINFLSESGIRYFMETGRFAEVPLELYSPLTKEERREMLLKLAESPTFSARILKKELSPPEGMLCLEVMDKSLFIEFLVPERGMCFLYVNEPGILMAFRRFFGGFSRDDLYSEEESRIILRMIAQESI